MQGLTTPDAIAVAWFLVCAVGYGLATRVGPLAGKGLVHAVNRQRLNWMRNMVIRDNRVVDVQILAALSRGNAFFGSTAALVTGALAALFGAADEVQFILRDIPFLTPTTRAVWEIKVILLMAIFISAFFKFAWAYRLSHYTAIMVGATPLTIEDDKDECLEHATRSARLAGLAGAHANAGLRAYYFGMAGLGWFIHPAVFILSVTLVVLVLYRREYRSRALKLIEGTT